MAPEGSQGWKLQTEVCIKVSTHRVPIQGGILGEDRRPLVDLEGALLLAEDGEFLRIRIPAGKLPWIATVVIIRGLQAKRRLVSSSSRVQRVSKTTEGVKSR